MSHSDSLIMHQLTIRGFDPELESRLRRTAKTLNLSLSKAALHLMRKGAGLAPERPTDVIGDSLDHLIGAWGPEEAAEFQALTSTLDQIDEELWK